MEGVAAAGLTTELVGEFVLARRLRGERRFVPRKGMGTLLGYLRGAAVIPEASHRDPVGPTEQLLERYYRFLVHDRGLADAVVVQYEAGARLFLDFLAESSIGRIRPGWSTRWSPSGRRDSSRGRTGFDPAAAAMTRSQRST
jgi:hypothetical protein